jgi:diadenosine tetraphosphate (Ap4A) HIT family hydrolase
MTASTCDLCKTDGGQTLYRNDKLRVVLVDEPSYPGFCRVVWHDHVREMTDLSPSDRLLVMQVVWAVESAIREVMQPEKINVASLGNMTPHVHWHVIPRFADDATFPGAVWSAVLRQTPAAQLHARQQYIPQLTQAVSAHVQAAVAGA